MRTEIALVLDRSGSMGSCWPDTVGGVRHFIEEQKKDPADTYFTLCAFDNQYEILDDGVPMENVAGIEGRTYPRGSTALLDAIGNTINSIGNRVSKLDNPDDTKVIFVIVTDGYENSSREYSTEKIRSMIQHQQDKYGWEIMYLGADHDAITEAAKYGISGPKAMSYDKSDQLTSNAMYGVVSRATLAAKGPTGQAVAFSDEDRDAAMGSA